MPRDEWVGTLTDGRAAQYSRDVVPGDGTSMTAKVRGDNIILTGSSREMTREQVEAEFASELGGRQTSEQR